MKKQLRIILYGDTLVLAGIRLSLEANPAFEVIPLNAPPAAERELFALEPDVLIFDNSSVQPQFHYNLNQMPSRFQIIGIDPDRGQVLVWSGEHLPELSIQDLVEVIHHGRKADVE